ncbi:IclR family transcriptional regulator [Bosea caraganae]|uniref:IclR family transcriptional regulator n=1 Tax=Bosea caraganae TaxID=2763117 RepID=A0A370KYU5_9HYPH|nr:IclR family transcriptional regulator [Bosea caraganae]RDJ20106.1 IclR family transcriptional regulator [Bosea caraganae]RDJ24818.1 IclR family transcriptional regulator [Bosea caraganae]
MDIEEESADNRETHKNHDIYFVPGLRRGLLLLETVADARRPLSVSEIARRLSLTRSTVFRLTYTLRFMGFLEEVADSKSFTLGPRVLNIGYAYLASKDIIEVSRADLELLRDNTNVSAHLAIRDRKEVLYLSCVQTRSGFLSNLNVGTRLPAYATPMGWLLLSDLSSREIGLLFESSGFEPMTEQTPKSVAELMGKVSDAVVKGYVISRGVVEAGGSTIAAPIFDRNGKVAAAIDISGPDTAFDMTQIETLDVQEVVNAALRISARLGYVPKR